MSNLNKFILTVLVIELFLLYLQKTSAFFSDSAHSSNNDFIASTEFPSPTPTITPTITPTLTPTPTLTITPTVAPGDIVINEINWGGSTISTADEWIELKNVSSNSIDLTGWIIENLGSSTTPNITISGGIISPNSFFVISNYNKEGSIINVDPDTVDNDIILHNDGEQLVLKNELGVVIDTANNSGSWFVGDNVMPQKSMERNDPPGDGTQAINWHSATMTINLDSGAIESASPKYDNS